MLISRCLQVHYINSWLSPIVLVCQPHNSVHVTNHNYCLPQYTLIFSNATKFNCVIGNQCQMFYIGYKILFHHYRNSMANEVVLATLANHDTEKIEYQQRFNLKNKVNFLKLKMLMSVSINPTLLPFNCFHSALYWNTGVLKCVTRNQASVRWVRL